MAAVEPRRPTSKGTDYPSVPFVFHAPGASQWLYYQSRTEKERGFGFFP